MEALVCKFCWTNIFNTKAFQDFLTRESYDFFYATTYTQIATFAESTCNWCSFLISALPSPNSPEWPSSWTPTNELSVILDEAYVMENASPKGLNLCELDFGTEGSPRDWHIEFNLCLDEIDGLSRPVTARPLQPELNSPEAYSQIDIWLDECKNHQDCGPLSLNPVLPSRLIEVLPAGTHGPPRLRSTQNIQGPYLALSYCWGSGQSYILTTENIELMKEKLETELLSATILDAIEVTKTLGIKYLWVDALCIMQDLSEAAAREDMNRELAKMDEVYKHALMTIVAACAPSAKDGFLNRRPPTPHRHFDIPCRLDEEHFFVAHIREHLMYDDGSEPINARAWTFQEHLLSPRLLIYASHTLQWQCRTATYNRGGSYHSPRPSTAPRLQSTTWSLQKAKSERDQHEPKIPHSVLQMWLKVVSAFSRRKLTLSSDKLPAISALAKSNFLIFGSEYHAGIWVNSAVQQLCWRSPEKRVFFRRPRHYRAPSWSWAALDGPVYFPSFLEIDNDSACIPFCPFKILEWQTSLSSPNIPYGEVTFGRIVVETVLRDGLFDPLGSPSVSLEADATIADSQPMQTAQAHVDVVEDNFRRQVRCLAMYRRSQAGGLYIGGLMLAKSPAHTDSHQRIGVFSAEISLFEGFPLETVQIV